MGRKLCKGIRLAFAAIQLCPDTAPRKPSKCRPTVLNAILGPIQAEGSASRFEAFVSAPAEDDTHPRKIVLNAFMRRGGRIIATQGSAKIYYGGFPQRDGYVSATPLEFSTKVEEYD